MQFFGADGQEEDGFFGILVIGVLKLTETSLSTSDMYHVPMGNCYFLQKQCGTGSAVMELMTGRELHVG